MNKLVYRVVVLHKDIAFLKIVITCETLDDVAEAVRTIAKHFPPTENFQIVCQPE